jgi:D-serine deaminase-like pyridoxal phosphate-dependent protein
MITSEYSVSNETEIASPALLLFSERIDRNIARMIEIAGGVDRLRPHVKTHKLDELIRRQIAAGITKFKASTIAEAEMCARSGAADVLLAYPPAGPTGARLCQLMLKFPQTRFAIIADHAAAIRGLSVSARAAGVTIDVYLDLDVGMGRTGIAPGPAAAELYRLISDTPALRAAGLHAYDGHIHDADAAKRRELCDAAFEPVEQLRAQLEAEGHDRPALVAGGSPTFPIHAGDQDRECSPGTTVLWDFSYGEKFTDMPFEIAAVLLTRVVSKPGAKRLCLDLGHKAVAAENPLAARVRLVEIPDAEAVMQSEEHLVVETAQAGAFSIGQVVHALPRHVCPTVALHAEAVVVEGNAAGPRWPIHARARRLTI